MWVSWDLPPDRRAGPGTPGSACSGRPTFASCRPIPPGADPDQLAFELGAILAGSNIAAILHDDNTIIDRARQAVRARLGA